ncbi:hypothetical protein CUMW_117090 [Citrus unshiu]|nr:hypothetical protein CUMW_117090 [Citrus unshiu]
MVIKLKGKTVKYRTEEHPPTATIKGEQQRQNSKKTHSAFVVSCPKFRGFNLGEGGKSKRIRKVWIGKDTVDNPHLWGWLVVELKCHTAQTRISRIKWLAVPTLAQLIKKIMKADEDVRMISAEAPVIFARACEMFILELTLRSWNHTEENKRRTLQKNDIAAAITRTDIFDFLVDIVPREDLKDEVLASIPRGTLPVGGPPDMPPYCYMPTQHASQVGSAGLIMGKPVMDPAIYAQQPHPYMGQQMWPQGADQQQEGVGRPLETKSPQLSFRQREADLL